MIIYNIQDYLEYNLEHVFPFNFMILTSISTFILSVISLRQSFSLLKTTMKVRHNCVSFVCSPYVN